MSPVAQLLARNRFTPFHRELLLERSGAWSPATPEQEAPGVTVTTRIDARVGTAAVAHVADQEAGVCDYGLLERISDDPAAAQWGYIWGLDVVESMRRRGIGRLLMHRALAHLSAQGCRGCWLTTDATNWPAQALYLALGFEVVDASTCFRKELPGA
jgi:ribosomal protein S18 acetylase RimI-like enzyme